MTYILIQPPFVLNIREMPKKELRRYFQWFMDVLPGRIALLAEAVRETPGFTTWQPDLTPESLNQLGEWFASQVETRKRTQDEIQAIKDRQEFPIDISNETLAPRTYSLAMDVGMYLSQVLLRNNSSLKWEQPIGSKRFIDYGQPVLVEFSSAPLNPVGIVVTLAHGLVSKKRDGRGLRTIYDIWSKMALPTTK
jgi:hypothetical protein